MMAINFYYTLILPALMISVTGNEVVIGILGNSVSLECGLSLSDTLIWEDSDGIVLAMHGAVTTSLNHKYVIERQNNLHEILIIHDVSLTDEKMYRCYDLMNKNIFEISSVTVLVKPPIMQLSYPNEAVLEGTEVTLLCEADGGKPLPVITWRAIGPDNASTFGVSHDTLYTNGTGRRRSLLTVIVTRDTYMTSYVCDISVSVFYHHSLTADLDVKLKPLQPVIFGYLGAYDAGKNLSLECKSTGSNPAAIIFWLLDGVRLGDYEFEVIPEMDGLYTVKSFFRRVMPPHLNASVLTCAVTNSVLEKQGLLPQMTNITLLESFKPNIMVAENDHTGTEGSDVTLTCMIEARPDPTPSSLAWYKDNVILDKSLHVITQKSGMFQLHIHNLSRSDAGYYTCGAANRVGMAYSAAISLTVLYVPVCRSATVEKHAANIGDRLRLHCHMDAFPSDVKMQWLYPDTGLIIQTNKSNYDIQSGHPHGSLDLVVSSYTLNKKIYCYASNTIGQGHTPCQYQIVQPSAPEPPINCSCSTTGSSVEVICRAGFNGGSTQMFMLDQFEENGYEPVVNNSVPVFQITRSKNTTIRVCAVNEEFNDIKSCVEPINIVILQADIPNSQPVEAKKTNKTAYIAGSITAFIGILIITVIFIVICRRRKKQIAARALSSALRNLKPATKSLTKDQKNSTRLSKNLWQRIISIIDTNKRQDGKSTKSLRRGKIVTREGDSDDDNVTYQTIEVIASTPHHPSKHHRLNLNESNTSFLRQFVGEYRPKADKDGNLMILNATTGISLSPISIHSQSRRMSNLGADYTVRDDHTEAMTGVTGDAYCTADIRDILGDRTDESTGVKQDEYRTTNFRDCHDDFTGVTGDAYRTADIRDILGDQTNKLHFTNDQSLDDGMVTRHKDYSAGDILEVLGTTEWTSNQNEQCTVSQDLPNYEESLASVLRFDIREGDNSCDFSKNNLYTGELSNFAIDREKCVHDSNQELCKAYSLPYRTKTKSSRIVRINSLSNIYTIANKDTSAVRNPSANRPNETNRGSEFTSFASAMDYTHITRGNALPNSVFTDTVGILHDIDRYTLTTGSVSSSEYNSADVDTTSDDDPNAYICVMGGHSIDESSVLVDAGVRSVVRRNSFLSAVRNDQCYSTGDDCEYMLPTLFNESEHTYVNDGLDLNESNEIKCAQDNEMCSNTHISDNRQVNVVAYF